MSNIQLYNYNLQEVGVNYVDLRNKKIKINMGMRMRMRMGMRMRYLFWLSFLLSEGPVRQELP